MSSRTTSDISDVYSWCNVGPTSRSLERIVNIIRKWHTEIGTVRNRCSFSHYYLNAWRIIKVTKVRICSYIYRSVFSPSDRRSRRSTLHPVADMFLPTPIRLLWEIFMHAVDIVRRLFTPISTTAYSQVLIFRTEWTLAFCRERKCPSVDIIAASGIRIRALSIESGILPHPGGSLAESGYSKYSPEKCLNEAKSWIDLVMVCS